MLPVRGLAQGRGAVAFSDHGHVAEYAEGAGDAYPCPHLPEPTLHLLTEGSWFILSVTVRSPLEQAY
jgi:hypothetical protein